jgi:hypothetical protein
MKNIMLTALVTITSCHYAQKSVAQTAPILNRASEYSVFSSAGEFANNGTTIITGNIGNGAGAETGNPVTITGQKHFGDTEGVLTAADVITAYGTLTNTVLNPCQNDIASTVNGSTFLSGVHCGTTATSLSGDIVFDGDDNPNALFIIKIDGALSVNGPFNITLTGGAQLKNIYWQVNGAFNLAAGLEFKGTVINAGAISLATGASITGRVLSTAGKISLNNNIISNTQVALPVTLVRFTVKNEENKVAQLSWSTTFETNSERFEIERKTGGNNWNKIATLLAKGESAETVDYFFTDKAPHNGNNLYRLKMIDTDNTFAYSSIRNISIQSESKITLFPNPAYSEITIESNDISKMDRIEFNDLSGRSVMTYKRNTLSDLPSNLNVKHLPAGLYIVRMTDTDGNTSMKKMIKK